MRVKVKEGQKGYTGGRMRYEGEEFEIDKKLFSEKWMEEVKKPGRPPKSDSEDQGSETQVPAV